MRKKAFLIHLIFFLNYSVLSAQISMDKGFKQLENGNFKKAKVFFETILKKHPHNKTARLCYGRALGLTGDVKGAIDTFTNLLNSYPDDFEIQLNYAESLLWDKQFLEAKKVYEKLLRRKPSDFYSLLGYANTLSNLKDFKEALPYVNSALEKLPDNPNALLSRKYIRLGLADQLHKDQQSDKAFFYLNKNLNDFKSDKESLLLQANIYLSQKKYDAATNSFIEIASSKNDSIIALNGLSLIAHLKKKNKKSLAIAVNALQKTSEIDNKNLIKQTEERYVQSLIWNKKFQIAEEKIKELYHTYSKKIWIHSLTATLEMYKGNTSKSISYYKEILVEDLNSFDANIGIANAFFAGNQYQDAHSAIRKTLNLFPNQKDAVSLKQKLALKFTPHVEEKFNYSFDSGNNTSCKSNTFIEYPLSTKLSLTSDFKIQEAQNSNTRIKTGIINFNGGINYQFLPKFTLVSSFGINAVNSESVNYNQFSTHLILKMSPFNLHTTEIGFSKLLESFNADLLNRRIVNDNYFINYNISTNFNLGWFTQYYFTQLRDDNQRNLLFTSLYYSFLSTPALKGGFNYQFITFNQQFSDIYFSPEKFYTTEIFVELLKDENNTKPKNWFYTINASTGFQSIEKNSKQFTYRVQSKLGYKFSNRLVINLFSQHTNIASATVTGFAYTNIGVHLQWFFKDTILRY